MPPLSGPEVGGTEIKNANIKQCLDDDVNVCCGFRSYDHFAVVVGERLNEFTISCIHPPDNGDPFPEVYYSVFIQGCSYDPDEARWNTVDETFDYASDVAGVVLAPISGDFESSRLIYPHTTYIAEWNSKSLLLSALVASANLKSLKIDIEVHAYYETNNSASPFPEEIKLIKTQSVSSLITDTMKFMFTNQDIKEALYTYESGLNVGMFFLIIVAYGETKLRRVVYAVRASKLMGVISEETEAKQIGNSCPVLPIDRCGQDD